MTGWDGSARGRTSLSLRPARADHSGQVVGLRGVEGVAAAAGGINANGVYLIAPFKKPENVIPLIDEAVD